MRAWARGGASGAVGGHIGESLVQAARPRMHRLPSLIQRRASPEHRHRLSVCLRHVSWRHLGYLASARSPEFVGEPRCNDCSRLRLRRSRAGPRRRLGMNSGSNPTHGWRFDFLVRGVLCSCPLVRPKIGFPLSGRSAIAFLGALRLLLRAHWCGPCCSRVRGASGTMLQQTQILVLDILCLFPTELLSDRSLLQQTHIDFVISRGFPC